jgi:hypothetical protein
LLTLCGTRSTTAGDAGALSSKSPETGSTGREAARRAKKAKSTAGKEPDQAAEEYHYEVDGDEDAHQGIKESNMYFYQGQRQTKRKEENIEEIRDLLNLDTQVRVVRLYALLSLSDSQALEPSSFRTFNLLNSLLNSRSLLPLLQSLSPVHL